IKGKTNNRTILSLLVSPTVIEQVASHIKQGNLESALETKFRSLLEEMFINWTTQIHEIIQEKSDCVHSSNTPAAARAMKSSIVTVTTPQQEIHFWLNRQQNLQNIYNQLRESSHKTLAFILESIDSAYYLPFMKIFKRLIFAWQESKDITLWLQPLLRQTATFNAVNFCNAQELIAPLVHVIHLIWSNARHYRTTQRMTVLLRCICNLMVRRAAEDLEVSTLFHTEADEGLLKICRTIEILEMFKSKLLEYKTKYTSNQTILPALPPLVSSPAPADSLPFSPPSMELQQLWRFSNEDVFGLAFNGFLEQLLELQTIFEAAVTFQSLEKLEIGGSRGKMLTDRIRQIHSEFKLLFEDWTKLEIDLGQSPTLKDKPLKEKQIIFFQRMHVLEKKLATILQQAYNDCHNWEQLAKLTTMFANIVQRQTIQTELMVILPHIFSVLKEELLLIETIVSEVLLAFEYKGVEAIPMEMNFPTIAGAMMWLENYMKRCDVFAGNELNALITTLLTADNPLSSQYEKLTARRDILTTKLSNLQLKIWNNWQQTIEKRIAKGLDSKVMMMTMSTMKPKNQQQQQNCTSSSVENLAEAEGYTDVSIRCRSSDCVSKRNKKLKNTWLANNQAQSYSSPTNASAAYCHHVNTALTDKTDSTFGFLYNSNERLCNALAEDDVLNKSSFVSDMKILKINLSIELFTLLRETKYMLALQEIHKRQKHQGETTATTTSSNSQLTTQLTVVSLTQQHQQLHLQQQQQQPHQLPLTLLDLYAQRDIFWQRKIKLMKIAEYYNSIREGLNTSNEMQLIQPVVDVIDERVECASKTLTWRYFDAELVDDIYKKTQTLHSRLQDTRKNIQTILDSVRRWSREPLHQRSLYGKNLLELKHQKERLRTRVMQCEETKLLLNRLLIENFYLFFNYGKQEKDIQDKNILEFLRLFPEHQRSKYISYLKSIDDLIYQEVKYAMKISLEYLYNEMSTTATTTVQSATATENNNATTSAANSKLALATITETKTRTFYYHPLKNMKSMETSTKTTVTATTTINVEVTSPSSLLSSSPTTTTTKSTTTNAKHFLPELLKNSQSQNQQHVYEKHELQPLPLTTAPTTKTLLLQPLTPNKLTRRPLSSSCSPLSSKICLREPITSAINIKSPLFEVKLELLGMQIRFQPTFESNVENNFQQIVEQLLQDISRACNCMPRIFRDNSTTLSSDDEWGDIYAEPTTKAKQIHDYRNRQPNKGRQHEDIIASQVVGKIDTTTTAMTNKTFAAATIKDVEIKQLNTNIRKIVSETLNAAKLYALQFEAYKHLWCEKYSNVLNQHLKDIKVATTTTKQQSKGNEQKQDFTINKEYYVMETFKREIERYNELHDDIELRNDFHNVNGWLSIDIKPLKYTLLNMTCKWSQYFKKRLLRYVETTLEKFNKFIKNGFELLQLHVARNDFRTLLQVLEVMAQIKQREAYADNLFKPLKEMMQLLKTYNVQYDGQLVRNIDQLPVQWQHLKAQAVTKSEALQDTKRHQQQRVSAIIMLYMCHLQIFAKKFQKMAFFQTPCSEVYSLCDEVCLKMECFTAQHERISYCSQLLGIAAPDDDTLRLCAAEVRRVKQLWDFVHVIESCIDDWRSSPWLHIDTDDIENECKQFTRDLRTLDKSIREWSPYLYIVGVLRELVASLRTITELQNPAITERHWMELMHVTKLTFKTHPSTTLEDLLKLELHKHEEDIKNTVDRAIKEMSVTKILDEIKATWSDIKFDTEIHQQRADIRLLKVSEGLIETLDDNQMQIQNIATSKHVEYLLDKLTHWQRVLSSVDLFISNWFDVQRKWVYLECIFIGSPDIRAQLPQEAQFFEEIDEDFTQLLKEVTGVRYAIVIVQDHQHVFSSLAILQKRLSVCEKALNEYLETKRLAFPRFYFISSADLLDILSNGNNPLVIDRHFIKLFDSILRLAYESTTKKALGMFSKENDEYVHFTSPQGVLCSGRVEIWLNDLINEMRSTLHELFKRALNVYLEKTRDKWLNDWPAQVALCCSQICWTADVNRAFAWMEEGYEAAMKELHKRQIIQLNALINLLLGELTPGDRQKIMTLCTIDVHSRDVVGKIIQARVDSSLAFQWQSQLRHRWDDDTLVGGTSGELERDADCFANICDAEFRYAYEYLGNTSRLVITPLTDRCYITLTQSLHLVMGGAPAGPAGTGKTETTKDLGRALGVMVYVFNCSEQMDYKSCGNIYKGLAQTGAWGCFDEFNRISVEVLSVVAVQVKTIQEAIKMHKTSFVFMGETIPLVSSIGIFITMNPGYAGRTELPENLKSLFRPCAMIVPDFALICEIMLMAEGFQDARLLARKFITLYTLCKELLSKQDHYDWGLRAIKSVLVVAGTLKRDDHSRPEDQVLMRALRDFNIPKIVTEDISIFMGLIGDLFPALDVPRKRVFDFEKTIRRAVNDIKLQPEEGFLMKVVQLQELLDVRHSVFIVGNAGTGKTKIWQTLRETYRIQKLKPVCNILNPKALTNDELFGIVNPTTREWKDGLFSSIMREQANMTNTNPKWIVLDGDIDPMWIESLNTLMDDNKILTLANNERISLKKEMRLLFEVGHLKAATPATVSRAGILYINPLDLGWSPYVSSWLETRSDMIERGILTGLFEKYFPKLLLRHRDFRRIIPISDIAVIQMSCNLLECLLDSQVEPDVTPSTNVVNPHSLHHSGVAPDSLELYIELIFVYAVMWGFGSALYQDHIIDWHREFHKWWTTEFKDIKLPSHGTIYDYYLDVRSEKFIRWSELASQKQMPVLPEPHLPIQNILIPTIETTRLVYFLELLVNRNLPCMLVGNSGCGKGAIFREFFSLYANAQDSIDVLGVKPQLPNSRRLSQATPKLKALISTTVQTTHFNFYTSSEIFQKILDRPLEKKSGRTYAPSGAKRRLIYFINDLNMPEVDAYGTVQPHTIMRQFMDYKQWYDRQCLQLKNIRYCQFAACMNPTAGSFTIDPRLQRHFCVFSVASPSEFTLQYVYGSILSAHLENPSNSFSKEIKSIGQVLVKVGIALHKRMECGFLPTAVKFHYIFNMRDLTHIYQGLLNSLGAPNIETNNMVCTRNFGGTICNKPADLIRLYVHEAFRVYHDRLVDPYDIKSFRSSIRDIFKKDIEDFDEEYVFSDPLIYCHFAQSLADQKYMPLKSWDCLYQLLMEAQANYNEVIGYMNLVLFEDAMKHVCRINRILESPRNNVLLVGVGGSGKQTLARLASFISSFSVFQIQIKRGFSLQDMKEEIGALYMKVGLKNMASVFLMSDAQIPDESLLMLINDLLAAGEIPELFSDDQLDTIVNGIRNEVKQSGTLDTKENCWRFFVDKVRRLLRLILCFSPVGQTLRVRARKFPAILSHTCIDWFHEWPKSALESVSQTFLSEINPQILPRELINPVGCFMAYVHGTVNQISKIYLQNEKRYNYTTPKTFLEYVFLYRKLLVDRSGEHTSRIQRLQSGMAKLAECARQVDTLKNQLAVQEIELNAKNAAADKLILIVSAESEKVKHEKHIASEEEKRVRIIEEDVTLKTKLCEDDLRKAEPALVAAQAALNTLNKNNLTELKSFGSPPKAVVNVCSAVMVLFAVNGKIPRDRSWKAAKLMMVRVDQFLNDLVNYNKDNIHPNVIEVLQEYLKDPEFKPDKIVQKSVAAAGLCAWVINIHRYHQVFLIVGPKQQALKDSQNELSAARERLDYLKVKINNLERKLSEIQAEFEDAVKEKQKCQHEADKTTFTIDLAHRLVNGLANENIRWKESVQNLQSKSSTLPGDILLISSFLSYAGCFTRRYREELQQKMWMSNFRKIQPPIPHTDCLDHLSLFTDDAQIATWNNEGLPMDRMSTENATILVHSTRWPLMIDPQLQGIKWIKNRFGDALIIIRLTQKNFLDTLEKAMSNGDTVLLEQIEETVDTVLEPLLSRALIKRGRFIRIGDKELDFNPKFRLILHTKLANPHYKPEMQAQTTLINFTVTQDGLEEQLLAEVVKIERPDLEEMKTELTIQQNKFKISLKELEDDLLARLASAGENVLDDYELVANLESTKHTVDEIEIKVNEARVTTLQIDEARNMYRAAAKRAAILYFVLSDLSRISPIYRFSLKSFMHVFRQAIVVAPQYRQYEKRVSSLVDSITCQTFYYALRGLFEVDKLTFTAHMTLRILAANEQISLEEIDFLLRFPHDPNTLSPVDFIGRIAWSGIKSLALMDNFYGIDKDIENYPKRWRKFSTSDVPEREQFPGEWKHRTPLQKLCIMRALRPDRVTNAIRLFVEQTMGQEYAHVKTFQLADIFSEINAATPIFFILCPGVDPIYDVERLGLQLGFSTTNENLINISLGQGQEIVAEQAIAKALDTGQQWVVLQNIHLVANWLPTLEKLIESITSESEHLTESKFRLFISAEPAPDPQYHIIPQGILESSLKIVNEPPSGMAANMHKAWDNFSQEALETCTQEAEFKSILFSLCYFHAVAGQRRKFGPLGWNKVYPFNIGDLTISASVLHNYLEGSNRIPWEDLRYLFGEIMYGGHITDDWDRRLCQTYLEELLQQDLVDGDMELCPGFPSPPNLDFQGYHNYINEMLPAESPLLYGLHPNAEIGFLTNASEQLLKTVFELQPRQSELSTTCGAPREELVKIMADDFLDKLQVEFNLQALLNRVERKTPFVVVALQECERMNNLIWEIKRSLRELLLGLKGELTITSEMERLDHALFYDHVPESWTNLAYPSMLGLQSWFADLLHRIKELSLWLNDFKLPCSIWLGGLFNPQSFLTAIMQESARKHDLPLDRMCLACDVTKKDVDSVTLPPLEGAFIHGLYLDGASWDCQLNSIVPLHPKELLCPMPVICIKSIVQEKQDLHRIYECPLYKTRSRGNTYVWTFNLKSRERPSKWILGGVALLLQA
ncbi:dynein beta chain, ciliary, partial [Lucilia sericata]|uniref:dynein beta chain, ciliary n=1 Tax=Lucilia sericata TaxID=13632 RepID=UPI0018A87613